MCHSPKVRSSTNGSQALPPGAVLPQIEGQNHTTNTGNEQHKPKPEKKQKSALDLALATSGKLKQKWLGLHGKIASLSETVKEDAKKEQSERKWHWCNNEQNIGVLCNERDRIVDVITKTGAGQLMCSDFGAMKKAMSEEIVTRISTEFNKLELDVSELNRKYNQIMRMQITRHSDDTPKSTSKRAKVSE